MRLQSRPGARIVTACSLLLLTSASAFAQPAQPSPGQSPPAQVPSAQPAAPAADRTGASAVGGRSRHARARAEPRGAGAADQPPAAGPRHRAGPYGVEARIHGRHDRPVAGQPAHKLPVGRERQGLVDEHRGNLRREPAAALGHELRGCLRLEPVHNEQRFLELQPAAGGESRLRRSSSRCCAASGSTTRATSCSSRRRTARSPTWTCSRRLH